MQGQLVAPLIPALLPLAESTGATPAEMLAAFMVGFEVASRLSRANPNHNGGGAWHATGTIGTIAAAAACARLLKLPARRRLPTCSASACRWPRASMPITAP